MKLFFNLIFILLVFMLVRNNSGKPCENIIKAEENISDFCKNQCNDIRRVRRSFLDCRYCTNKKVRYDPETRQYRNVAKI